MTAAVDIMVVLKRRVYNLLITAADGNELIVFFFFFKQKTAYEIRLSLVGSEMCIRDRTTRVSTK